MTAEEKAALAKERLAACKKYMKGDYEEDDELIAALMDANDGYLADAGVRRDVSPARHDLIVHAMTLQMYDARGADTIEEIERFAFYERAKGAYLIIATGEQALYANLLLQKGVVTD